MCNCENKRQSLRSKTIIKTNTISASVQPSSNNHPPVLFQYTGNTALTVTGRSTRKTYRFNFSGDKQFIDHNDASSMMQLPVLKKLT